MTVIVQSTSRKCTYRLCQLKVHSFHMIRSKRWRNCNYCLWLVVFFLVVPKAVINSRLKISSTGPIFVSPVFLYIYMLCIFGILSFVGRISVLSSKFLLGLS